MGSHDCEDGDEHVDEEVESFREPVSTEDLLDSAV